MWYICFQVLIRTPESGIEVRQMGRNTLNNKLMTPRPLLHLSTSLCFPPFSLVVAMRAVTSLPVVTQPLSRAPITKSHCLLPDRPGHTWVATH